MAEETRRRLPQIARDNTRSESLEETVKDSISRLQSSIRQGLALNRREIKASTSAILAVQETLAQAFNINTDLIEIEKEKMRLAEERRREDERKKNQKQKDDKGFIAKAKGGLFDVLKKVFFGTALVGAAMVVLENWDTIVETFEKIKPTLIAFKDGVVEFATVAIPFLIDNFGVIAKTMASIVAGGLLLKAVQGLVTAYTLVKGGITTVATSMKGAHKAVFGRGGLIHQTRKFNRNVARNVTAMATAVKDMGKAALEWAKSKASQLVKLVRAVVTATSTYAKTTLIPALASLKAGLIAAAPFAAIAAGIAFVVGSLVNAISDAKAKFEETGSIWLAIEEGISKFIGMIIGFPIKLIADGSAWIARQLGFEEFADSLSDFDPVSGIKETFRKFMRFIYDPETGLILGLDFNNILPDFSKLGDQIMSTFPEIKMPEFDLPEITLPDFPNPFKDLQKKIQDFDYSMFDFGIVNFGDEIKSFISGLFGEPTSVTAETVTPTQPMTGAEVDVRSREVASQTAQPNVTVAAPQTNMSTDNSVRVNKTSVASASPRRNSKPWWAGRNYATN